MLLNSGFLHDTKAYLSIMAGLNESPFSYNCLLIKNLYLFLLQDNLFVRTLYGLNLMSRLPVQPGWRNCSGFLSAFAVAEAMEVPRARLVGLHLGRIFCLFRNNISFF